MDLLQKKYTMYYNLNDCRYNFALSVFILYKRIQLSILVYVWPFYPLLSCLIMRISKTSWPLLVEIWKYESNMALQPYLITPIMIIMAMIVIHFTAIVRTSTSYNSVEFQVVTKINKRKKIREKIEIREYHFNRTKE